MANNLYITATEARSGKSAVSLGIMEMLLRKIEKVGFFRPIVTVSDQNVDNDINLIARCFRLSTPYDKMYAYTSKEASDLILQDREDEIIDGILRKYDELADCCDFILCEGTDFGSSTAAFELDINAEISNNLGSPVLLVANAHGKAPEQTYRSIEMAFDSLSDKGSQTVATIVNRVDPATRDEIISHLKDKSSVKDMLVYAIPNEPSLGSPTVGEIARILGAEVLYGEDQLNRHVYNFTVAAMQLHNFLTRIEHGSLIITPGDRADIIVACLAALSSSSMDSIAGILLTGGLKPEESVWKLIKGFDRMVPILSVKENTFPTATIVEKIHPIISPEDNRKISQALAVFEKSVNVDALANMIISTKASIVTPKMFEYELLQRARTKKMHIVLPEGEESRILQAAEILLSRDVVDITLLGKKEQILRKIDQLDVTLESVTIVDPARSSLFDEFVETYYDLRKLKGATLENSRDTMSDVNYFGTMMIYTGKADGMVSGSIHSTAATIRPAFEFIKTRVGVSIVSSVFFMCLRDRVLVYGDCAINPDPNAQELAEIALSSAQTAIEFGIEPCVAMLSYSTGTSGKGADVEKVREATTIAREKAQKSWPNLKIEGPIQYDAAVDLTVAKTKIPESEVAGKATVFIFPDLNAGNNTYKAVQRSAGAVAIGPVLQGLNCPVNDLSRGCTVPDIVNTVAITAIQAQSKNGKYESTCHQHR